MKKMRERRFRLVIDVYWIVRIYLLKWQRRTADPAAAIRKLVSENRLEEAARRLVEETGDSLHLHHLALQIQQRIHRLDQQDIQGVLSPAEYRIEQNRISDALLRLVERIA